LIQYQVIHQSMVMANHLFKRDSEWCNWEI
jgi:hypothetical protein